ncbi:hypothetical protein PS1_030725 [Malus domestica]|uniref:Uncharacterized protein n=1 Tax=Malus domestica TaxID=3750 RepID=A0A498K8F6_MALDO|nr:hypothetical protein DVH24_004209 [Malus domestica]
MAARLRYYQTLGTLNNFDEDLQTTLLQMLQRLESASAAFRRKADLVVRPNIPISLPQLGEKDNRERERLKNNQPEEAVADKHTNPFSEAPVNMISMAWAEKGKEKVTREIKEGRLADKLM